MKNYTVKIEPTSPLGTPIEADTLFGHLCWALTYLDGDAKLKEFLLEFDKAPPVVISNAFPENWLPFPNLPPLTLVERDELGKLFRDNSSTKNAETDPGLLFYRWLKDLSKQRLISIETFKRRQSCFNKLEIYKEILLKKAALEALSTDDKAKALADFSEWVKSFSQSGTISIGTFDRLQPGLINLELRKRDIFDKVFSLKILGETFEKEPGMESATHAIWHNAISRKTGTVIEGRLFDKEVTFYRPGTRFNVFIKIGEYLTKEKLEQLFEYVSRNGFGADKSTGNGRFDFEIEERNPFAESEDANSDHYMLLSNTNSGILKEYQREEVHYTMQTKFGKVGGLLSANARYSPFKKPVLLLNPGTVIKTSQNVEYMGENFRDVYLLWDNDGAEPQKPADLDIHHYGIGFPVKMRLK